MGSYMPRQLISSGSTFEQEIGYSRAVVQGDWIFVSGTTGFDCSTMTISDDVAEQTSKCLRNNESALAQAAPVWKTSFGSHTYSLTQQISPSVGPRSGVHLAQFDQRQR